MTHDDDKPLTPAQARQKLQKGLMDYLAGNDPGPIVFRLKRTKKVSETYPLKLTQHQRETLLNYTQLSRTLERKLRQAGKGNDAVIGADELGKAGVIRRGRAYQQNHDNGDVQARPEIAH